MEFERRLAQIGEILRRRLARAGEQDLARRVVVEWNPRLRSTAGRAWCREGRIELNPRLLGLDGGLRALRRTALHEGAHLLAHRRHPRRRIEPHGVEWRRACADLGIPGEAATHRLPLPRREPIRRFRYRCRGCGVLVERVRALRRPCACATCCRIHAGNRFDARFLLVRTDAAGSNEGTAPQHENFLQNTCI